MRNVALNELAAERLLAVLVAAAIFAAFAPVLGNGLLAWDDAVYVGNAAHLAMGRNGLRWAFGSFHMGQYVPVSALSYFVDDRLWGSLAGGYHLTNLLWEVAAGLAWFGFWRRLLERQVAPGRRLDAALAGVAATLLFCLHPLRTESVAWIAGRRDVLCSFFSAVALRCYLEACWSPSNAAGRWRAGALGCFVLSLLSKVSSASLPATMLILDVYPLRRLPADPRLWLRRTYRCVLLEKAPFVVSSLGFCALTAVALRRQGFMDGGEILDVPQRLTAAAYSVLFYVRKEFWPFPMLPVYDLPRPFDPVAPRFLAWSAAALIFAAVVWRLSRRRPAVGAAAAHYACALLPVSGLVAGGVPHLGADRFSDFPNLAFSGLAATVLVRATACPRLRATALATTGAILLVLGAATRRRCLEWRDDESLWRATLAAEPAHREAHSNLAAFLVKAGRSREAVPQAEAAARLDPDSAIAWNNLGAALLDLQRWKSSEAAYARAAALNPTVSATRRGWAIALEELGRNREGIEQLQAAVRLDPADAVARYDLGNALLLEGLMDPAADSFAEALRIDPQLGPAHVNLGRVLERQGLPAAAVDEYRAAVKLGGNSAALYDWGNVESDRGREEVAVRLYREALRLDPGFDDARFNEANALARLSRFREAAAQYRLLLARNPGDVRAAAYLRRVTGAGEVR